jgi:hypothetical protein
VTFTITAHYFDGFIKARPRGLTTRVICHTAKNPPGNLAFRAESLPLQFVLACFEKSLLSSGLDEEISFVVKMMERMSNSDA